MVIPSINCADFSEAEKKIRIAELFSPDGSGWIHLDVSDGKFTKVSSWGDPKAYVSLKTNLNLEVHLMVEDPAGVILAWLEVGAKRIIIHSQAKVNVEDVVNIAKKYGAEVMISFDPTQIIHEDSKYKNISSFQVLAVFPGLSGQKSEKGWEAKIKSLRELYPTATIEVDGGIDRSSAKIAKAAGADILVSGSYIFENPDPKAAFEELLKI